MSNKYNINYSANWEEFKKELLNSGYDEVFRDNFVKTNANGKPVAGVIKNTESYWRNIKWEPIKFEDIVKSNEPYWQTINWETAAVNRIEEEVNDVEFD